MSLFHPGKRKKKNAPTEISVSIDGFHSDVFKLLSQNGEVLPILIYSRTKINKK